jgi:hypothetical protein
MRAESLTPVFKERSLLPTVIDSDHQHYLKYEAIRILMNKCRFDHHAITPSGNNTYIIGM